MLSIGLETRTIVKPVWTSAAGTSARSMGGRGPSSQVIPPARNRPAGSVAFQ